MKLVFVALAFFAVSLACVYGQDLPICWVRGICVGSILATVEAKTYNDCLRLCKAESECQWATFFIGGHACFLFDECYDLEDKNEFCITSQQHCEIVNYSKILVATGINASNIADIEIIDLLTHEVTCEKLQNFPRADYSLAGGLGFDEKPLICGGESSSGSSSCYLYENGAWVTSDSLKQGRYLFAMAKYPSKVGSSKLFLTGGVGSTYLSTTEMLKENGWQTSVPLPVTIHNHCMVAVNSTSLLVIGGYQNKAESGATYFFNSETNIWSAGPTLGVARERHSCGSIRRHSNTQERTPIVVGGYDDIDSTEVLDTNTWTRGPNLPFAIYGAAMVEDPSGGVVLIGGRGNYKTLETLYRLPHAGSDATWEEMPQKLKTARYRHTAFLVHNEIAVCN